LEETYKYDYFQGEKQGICRAHLNQRHSNQIGYTIIKKNLQEDRRHRNFLLSDYQFYANRWLPFVCWEWEKQNTTKDKWHIRHDFGDDKVEIID